MNFAFKIDNFGATRCVTCRIYLYDLLGQHGESENDELCTKNEELCMKNEELCIKNEFVFVFNTSNGVSKTRNCVLKMMNFAELAGTVTIAMMDATTCIQI